MRSEGSTSLKNPPRGTYVAPKPSDLRSPCPLVNSFANHGYISRDGRNIRSDELAAAMNEIGISTALGAMLSRPIFLEYQDPKHASTCPKPSFLARLWFYLCNPWAILFSSFAMRIPGKVDDNGYKCIDLNRLALPGVVEHDVSLTRRDYNQGDNHTRQADLVENLLVSSTDDGRTISIEDFAALRRRRIEQQRREIPKLHYTAKEHGTACGEIAMILSLFGDGQRIPCSYAKAFLGEERFPVAEGWRKRGWFSCLGFVELGRQVGKVKTLVGLKF